ncbi:MAG: hypothetical protein NW224_15920 [Leptolyngbyaceae cyanobacterium bins.302]|nr:hypothetical protein [Leptolyngbyaceae cyanobacterium bins.302]
MKCWLTTTGAIMVALAPLSIGITQANELKQVTPSPNFVGRYLAAISDGDFLASTYHDGKLPNPNSAIDQLSVIPLPMNGNRAAIAQIPVSNSVTGAPHALSLSPMAKLPLWWKPKAPFHQVQPDVNNYVRDNNL